MVHPRRPECHRRNTLGSFAMVTLSLLVLLVSKETAEAVNRCAMREAASSLPVEQGAVSRRPCCAYQQADFAEGLTPRPLMSGKPEESRAGPVVAFTRLAAVETQLGDETRVDDWMRHAEPPIDFTLDSNRTCQLLPPPDTVWLGSPGAGSGRLRRRGPHGSCPP
jgi:hypothetical protein